MLFLFKEKPVEITAFVHEEFNFVKEFSPITKASEFIPDWYKKMPHNKYAWTRNGYELETQTGKGCVGIIKTFQNGYILPMWCDLAIQINTEMMRYQFSDNLSSISIHPNSQLPNFYESHMFCKLISPWMFKASEDIKMLYTEPTFFTNNKRDFSVPTAINQTINKCLSGNVFLFIENTPKDIMISHGTPLLHLIPLTDKPVRLNIEVTTRNKFYNVEPGVPRITFLLDGLKKLKLLRNKKHVK